MPNPELEAFIEADIIPQYRYFGRSHGIGHVRNVIGNSLEIAGFLTNEHGEKIDIDMVYAIAAYHDLGMSGPREIHHITGGKILMDDIRLRKWFQDDDLIVMKEAIEDHRASSDHAPRSIYGKIVADADRDLDPERVFTRAVEFGLEHYPELDKEGQWERFARHMEEKYSARGYLKLWIPDSPQAAELLKIHATIDDASALRRTFDAIFSSLAPSSI